MKYYYDITVVDMSIRKAKSVPVVLPHYYNCDFGFEREAVVERAVENGNIQPEDVQHICEVENMNWDDYQELLKFNREQAEK